MGVSVLADESIVVHFDKIINQKKDAEIGLLIGRHGLGSRDFILGLAPTPSQDDQPAATCIYAGPTAQSRKSSNTKTAPVGKVAVQLDVEWIAEHVRQLVQLLPGGLCVLGTYLVCPEGGLSTALPDLCNILQGVRDCTIPCTEYLGQQPDVLLLHVDSSNKKPSLKCAGHQCPPAALKPTELKFGPCLANLVCVTVRHKLQLSVPVVGEQQLARQSIAQAVHLECDRIRAATMFFGMNKDDSTSPLIDCLQKQTALASGLIPTYAGQLLCNLQSSRDAADASLELPSSCVFSALSQLSGTIFSYAYAHKREPLSQAAQLVKADLIQTLKVRLQTLLEQLDTGSTATSDVTAGNHKDGLEACVTFPRRVLVPWMGGIKTCDYVQLDEAASVATARAALMFSKIPSHEVEEVEGVALGMAPAPWNPHANQAMEAGAEQHRARAWNQGPTCSTAVLVGVAAVVAAAAALIAYMGT